MLQASVSVDAYTPEQQVLLWCIRVDSAQDHLVRDRLARGLDWSRLLDTARDHGLLPLLHTRLSTLAGDAVPAEPRARLTSLYVTNALNNLRLLQRLLQVLTLLSQRGIPAIPVKGVSLALQAYGDVALRHFVDLDILIPRPDDFFAVYEALVEDGYQPETVVTPAEVTALQRQVSNQHFLRDDCTLEIHWTIPEREYGFTLDGEALWARVERLPLQEKSFCSLAREDAYLFHVLHATKHQWNRLAWLADLAYMGRHPGLDWARIAGQARRLGVERILHTGLLLTHQLTGAPFPAALQAAVEADRHAHRLVRYLYTVLFADQQTATALFPLFMFRSRERWRDKLHYLTYPRHDDQAVVKLPKVLFPLYYLIRPVRLLTKFTSRPPASSR